MSVDLHTHSTASDGTVPPGELPDLAAAVKLTALALTDHDTTDGLEDFLARQPDFPQIKLIPGIEFSADGGEKELHIAGLYIDHRNMELQKMICSMRESRRRRSLQMIEKLAALGYEVSLDELAAAGAPPDAPGRPHFAQVLVRKYNFPDNKSVFERLLKRGLPGYIKRELPEPAEVIKTIKAAGGLAIWAHPFNTRNNINNYIRRTIELMKISGLDGLEAYHSDYKPSRTNTALRMAEEYNLAVSGGSDFHGSIHADIQLGRGRGNLDVPDEVLISLQRARAPKVVIC